MIPETQGTSFSSPGVEATPLTPPDKFRPRIILQPLQPPPVAGDPPDTSVWDEDEYEVNARVTLYLVLAVVFLAVAGLAALLGYAWLG